MIEIFIKAEGEKIFDNFQKKDCKLGEVAAALLRLKQIEQELIDLEFDDDLSIES